MSTKLIAEARRVNERFTGHPGDSLILQLADALEAAEAENANIKKSLDSHLPTVIYGLNTYIQELMHTTERETRTPMQVGLMAAHSAAHWIAKDVTRGGGEPLYDLPSVLDLMTTLKKERAANRSKEIWDSGYEACRVGLQKFRNPFNERKRS